MKIDIDTFGHREAMRRVRSLGDHAGDMSPVYMWISRDFERIENQQFDSQGTYGGHTWEPISRSWARHKAKVGGDPRVLHFRLALRESLTRRNALGAVRTVRPHEVLMGTRIPYAKFHVTGTGRMPPRQPIVIPGHDRLRWTKAMVHFVKYGTI